MTLLETIQVVAKRGFEVSFFEYKGYLRVTCRTFITCASFGFEIPDGYVAHIAVTDSKIIEKINQLCDEQDRAFASNSTE